MGQRLCHPLQTKQTRKQIEITKISPNTKANNHFLKMLDIETVVGGNWQHVLVVKSWLGKGWGMRFEGGAEVVDAQSRARETDSNVHCSSYLPSAPRQTNACSPIQPLLLFSFFRCISF